MVAMKRVSAGVGPFGACGTAVTAATVIHRDGNPSPRGISLLSTLQDRFEGRCDLEPERPRSRQTLCQTKPSLLSA
jgi:hypothetical protein